MSIERNSRARCEQPPYTALCDQCPLKENPDECVNPSLLEHAEQTAYRIANPGENVGASTRYTTTSSATLFNYSRIMGSRNIFRYSGD